jgi:hypothetical protein
MLKIKESWSLDSIRQMCIHENYYTRGNNSEYMELFLMVDENEPSAEMIERVAENIVDHSSLPNDWTHTEKIENVAWCIINEAIYRTAIII